MSESPYLSSLAIDRQALEPRAVGHKKRFAENKSRRRKEGRARMLARVRVPLGSKPGLLPVVPSPLLTSKRVHGLTLLASVSLHLAVVASSLVQSRLANAATSTRETLTVELREKPEMPLPAVIEPIPEAVLADQPSEEKAAPPKLAKKAPRLKAPTAEPPAPPADKTPPPRVVGLSFEATVDSPNGPAFAVGNTILGQTAQKAADPRAVQPLAPGASADAPASAASVNQKASRLPVAGVTIVPPKRKGARRPEYPEIFRKRGVETEVVVLVALDKNGKVTAVTVVGGSPYQEFNEISRKAALTESFEPATRNGLPIAYSLKYTYFFRLDEQ